MYALALTMSAATAAATSMVSGLPYLHLGTLDIGVPLQSFGILVALGVFIGASLLRRYGEWHGISDEHIRGLLAWVMVSGFAGAHIFDVVAYQWDKIGESATVAPAGWWFLPEAVWPANWPLILRVWDGISSYGGFIGGSIGFALYVWWKRLPVRLFADTTMVGLSTAFTIGRLGCTVVSDHIGAAVDPARWYSFIAMDYPRKLNLAHLAENYPGTSEFIRAWNLGLVEFLYLVPVTLIVLKLAFRTTRRLPAGFITALMGVLYAPVRFFMDFLRPEDTDPRHLGLTFAQWASLLALGIALYAAQRVLKRGAPAEVVAPTSREAQERLKISFKDEQVAQEKAAVDKRAEADAKKAEIARLRAEREAEDAEIEAIERAREEAARAKAAATDKLSEAAPTEAPAGGHLEALPGRDRAAPSKPAVAGGAGKATSKPASGGKSAVGKAGGKSRKG